MSEFLLVPDIPSGKQILYWQNLSVPDNFSAITTKREFMKKKSILFTSIIEHDRDFWSKHGKEIAIGLGIVSVILGIAGILTI